MRAVAEKLVLLREQLRLNGVNGFIVPHADEFQSEYLPPRQSGLLISPVSPDRLVRGL